MDYISYYQSPLGQMLLAAKGDALSGVWFEGQKYYGSTLAEVYEEKNVPILEQTKDWLNIYFQGENPDFMPHMIWIGSSFQKDVWRSLMEIPYGNVTTYGEIGNKLAKERGVARMAARAVGTAVGHNPISILVPCHRVVGVNGKLTGYAGGIDRKAALLMMEHEKM